MRRLLSLRTGWALAIYAGADLFCVGLGMGVPIFCILFGLPVGWFNAARHAGGPQDVGRVLAPVLVGAALTSAVTFLLMAGLWGRCTILLFGPAADLAHFGIPLILFDPTASFIGWLVLMIFISPFLQLLMTLFGSHVTLWWRYEHGRGPSPRAVAP